jgi:carotenoid 1,2-hydratase
MHSNAFQPSQDLWPIDRSKLSVDSNDDASAIQSAIPRDRRGAIRPSFARMDESILKDGSGQQNTGFVFGGGERASGTRRADGRNVGPVGGRNADGSPRFDQKVTSGGYCWWYVDALSDCGQFGLTIIAFVGSVFSPYYRFASRQSPALADDHCCLNVALYGAPGSLKNRRWTMTERSAKQVHRSSAEFVLGPSSLRWDGDSLVINIEEIGVPIPFPVKGKVRLHPHGLSNRLWALDDGAKHFWGPIAPSASVEVEMASPAIKWKGHAYFDANEGSVPLNKKSNHEFVDWDWSRASLKDGSTAVIYDVRQTPTDRYLHYNTEDSTELSTRIGFAEDANTRLLALKFSPNADSVEDFDAPERKPLPSTLWRMKRSIRSDDTSQPKVIQTLEDTPFYVRSVLESGLLGEKVISLHETLSVPKLTSMSTQLMLPWRMPRT